MFSSLLTKSGDVLVWFPHDRRMEQIIDSHNDVMNAQQNRVLPTEDNVIPCATWSLTLDPIRLPPLPPLPTLIEIKEDTKLIKIAAFDNNLIGLTNQGHVLKFDSLGNEQSTSHGRWTYVSLNGCLQCNAVLMFGKYSCQTSAK
jgi:SCF-associated factor 1